MGMLGKLLGHDRRARERAFWDRKGYLREDVTAFGEQMAELHIDTLTTHLDEDLNDLYRQALNTYDRVKGLLRDAADLDDLETVQRALTDGRYQRACVLAAAEDRPRPERLGECFLNPQHGPASSRASWTPPGGVARTVDVCTADKQRLEDGEKPDHRLIRVGDRFVPLRAAPDEKLPFEKIDTHRWKNDKLDLFAGAGAAPSVFRKESVDRAWRKPR